MRKASDAQRALVGTRPAVVPAAAGDPVSHQDSRLSLSLTRRASRGVWVPATAMKRTTAVHSLQKPAHSIQHAERMQIGLDQRLLLLALVDVLLAHAARSYAAPSRRSRSPLASRIDVPDVVGDAPSSPPPAARSARRRPSGDPAQSAVACFVPAAIDSGLRSPSGGHRSLLPFTQHRASAQAGFGVGRSGSRPQPPSSTAVARRPVDSQCLWLAFSNVRELLPRRASFWCFAFHSSNGMP